MKRLEDLEQNSDKQNEQLKTGYEMQIVDISKRQESDIEQTEN